MTPAEIIARAVRYARDDLTPEQMAELVTLSLTGCGIRLIGPDDAKLIETALTHASFALDGVVALDDEDEGNGGGSDTCQHAKRTVDRALKRIRALADGGGSE